MSLERKTPLTARKGLVTRTALKAVTGLTRSTGLDSRSELTRSAPAQNPGRGKTPQRPSSNEVPSSVRAQVYKRDGNRCVRCGKKLEAGNRQLQHRVPRGMGGRKDHARMSALILLCGASATDPAGCHAHVESHRLDAQAGGWLVLFGSDPTEHPVLYADGVRYLLDDHGSKEVAE